MHWHNSLLLPSAKLLGLICPQFPVGNRSALYWHKYPYSLPRISAIYIAGYLCLQRWVSGGGRPAAVPLSAGTWRSMQADGFWKYRRSLFTAPTADVCQQTSHFDCVWWADVCWNSSAAAVAASSDVAAMQRRLRRELRRITCAWQSCITSAQRLAPASKAVLDIISKPLALTRYNCSRIQMEYKWSCAINDKHKK